MQGTKNDKKVCNEQRMIKEKRRWLNDEKNREDRENQRTNKKISRMNECNLKNNKDISLCGGRSELGQRCRVHQK